MYERKRDVLEDKIRKDMETRNLEAGYEMFRYLGIQMNRSFWELRYAYAPNRKSDPMVISYGGYPFLSRLSLLKAYLEDC